jgi:pimeloyl-ACP methyl ester carboxylesterase
MLLVAAGLVAAGLVAAAACGGCFTPPLVLPGGMDIRDVAKLPYPAASQAVDIEVAPGEFLHGVFVPADDGAPIVVHLLESSGSFTPSIYALTDGTTSVTMLTGGRQVVWELADLGLASLIVDYSGVGPSDGERDPATLARDAQAIYGEALRRADGHEDRLVLRGTSIGALAAASLLEAGRRPAALLLVAPVRAETVALHFAQVSHGALVAFLARPFVGRGIEVDLVRVLGGTDVPTLVIVARRDELLPADEQARLRAAVEGAGGEWATLEPGDATLAARRNTINGKSAFPAGDHFPLAYAARHLLAAERTLLARRFPAPPGARSRVERLLAELEPGLRERFPEGGPERVALDALLAGRLHDDPTLAALTVLAGCTPDECRVYLDGARRTGDAWTVGLEAWTDGLDRERCQQRLDLSDPAGRVPVGIVMSMAQKVRYATSDDEQWEDTQWDLEHTLAFARGAAVARPGAQRVARRIYRSKDSRWTQVVALEKDWTRLIDQGVAEDDACRLLLRALLKGAGIEERVIVGEDGAVRLEVRDGGNWRTLDPRLMLEE